ncbi:MAG: hypothetical protein GFGODING_03141 [Flavobacteriales bacterium]|nr:hypothetical protein [Flavobacteriales bacterium]
MKAVRTRLLVTSLIMALTVAGHGQERWNRTYDDGQLPNQIGSVCLSGNQYVIVSNYQDIGNGSGHATRLLDADGVELDGAMLDEPMVYLFGGASGSLHRLGSGDLALGGTITEIGAEPDGCLTLYSPDGDTLWRKRYGVPEFDNVNCIGVLPDSGFALFGTVRSGNWYDMRLIRTDANGDTMWTRRYGGPEDQQCLSGQRTLDGGYVLSGFKYFNNDHVNMYVVKTDSAGHQQWHQWYGSAWIDNPGFILQLPDSGYVLAGAQRLAAQGVLYPALYRLDKEGAVIWAEVYDQLEWGPFFTIPIHIPGEGYTIAGTMKPLGLSVGRLTKVDLDGELLWDREYRTNNQADHYFYDVKRTLDGGYIMAGTAFDSLLVSQDAWLVKVDSFGCLVPGCQVFDGLEEQMTDLGDVLEVYPNPARDQATVHIALPQGLERKNLRLALVSAEGKLVHEEAVPATATMHSLELSRYPAGLYFVHLRDGARWLAGTKLVLSPP